MLFNELFNSNPEPLDEGVLDNSGQEHSPVASAITRRILLQRTDLLSKYGPAKVGAAVDDVADFVGDTDEIGSSDVSGWVRQVEQMLGNMEESATEGSTQKIGNMDADAFDTAVARLKKLAGAGPMKTVYDPNTRRYKNVPIAVQPRDKK